MLSWSSSLTLLRLPFPHTSAVSVTATFPSSYNNLAYLHPFLFPVRALRQDLQWKKGCWTSFAGKSRSSFSASPSWKSLPVLTCDTSQPFEYFRNLEDISEMRLLGCWGVFCGFFFVLFLRANNATSSILSYGSHYSVSRTCCSHVRHLAILTSTLPTALRGLDRGETLGLLCVERREANAAVSSYL